MEETGKFCDPQVLMVFEGPGEVGGSLEGHFVDPTLSVPLTGPVLCVRS